MLDNFHICVILKRNDEFYLRRMGPSSNLFHTLIDKWNSQLTEFMRYTNSVNYTNCSRKTDKTRFVISDLELHSWLDRMRIHGVTDIPIIESSERIAQYIVGVVAVARSRKYGEILLFQNFKNGFLVGPGSWLRIGESRHSFDIADSRILGLDSELSAVYLFEEKKLFFRSYRNTNKFFSLEEYSKKLFKSDIDFVFNSDLFHPISKRRIYDVGDSIIRMRFARIKEMNILGILRANKVKKVGEMLETNVSVRDNKIVFPYEKREIKDLLDILTERKHLKYFTGETEVF